MRFKNSVLLIALLTLGWSGLASADDPTADSVESFFAAEMSDLSLDLAFEQATSPKTHHSMKGLGGPTSMHCQQGVNKGGLETCVVTAKGRLASAPAALAQP